MSSIRVWCATLLACLLSAGLATTSDAFPSNGIWENLPDTAAPYRLTHTGAYDSARHRLVAFGGSNGEYQNDTWVLDLNSAPFWKQLQTFGDTPSPRRQLASIYDPIGDRLIIYGGFDDQILGDVWALDLSGPPTWVVLNPTGPPPVARSGHEAIYDPVRNRMIVFGGYDGVSPTQRRNDVWELNLSGTPAWTELHPTGIAPTPRSSHTAIYDAPRDRIVVFGGTAPGFVNDVWALDLSPSPIWTDLTPADTSPASRESHTAIIDPSRDEMIIFGGVNGSLHFEDAWVFQLDGPPSWQLLSPAGPTPSRRWGHTAIFDPQTDQMVMYGGYSSSGGGYQNDVRFLFLDTKRWTDAHPELMNHSTIVDPARNQLVTFGGLFGNYRNETWARSLEPGGFWTELKTLGTPPSIRRLHTAIHDAPRDRMIVYGGFDDTYLGDLWELDFANGTPQWSPLIPSGTPPVERAGHVAIYDSHAERMLVFGGHDGMSPNLRRNDTWELSLTPKPSWTELTPAGALPDPRSSHTAIFDPNRNRVIIFGGTSPNYANDIWSLDLSPTPVWSELTPPGDAPHVRESHSAVYEPSRQRMIVFGGDDGQNPYYDDTWAFDLNGEPSWTELAPTGEPPTRRWGHSAAMSQQSKRMVIFGGFDSHITGTTWALNLDEPVPVDLLSFNATSVDGEVVLEWQTANERSHLGFNILRDAGDGKLQRLNAGLITSDAAPGIGGRYTYRDQTVEAGRTYAYRLESVSSTGDTERYPARSVVVRRAAPQRTVLHQCRPNPFNPSASIPIELAAAGHVELSVYDMSGRLIRTLVKQRLEAGNHSAEWDGTDHRGRSVSSGTYVARLTAGDRTLTQKMVLMK